MNENFWSEWGIFYVISNLVAVAMLLMAWKRPSQARYLYSVMFFLAALVNSLTAWFKPEGYLSYSKYTWPIYSVFIGGIFVQILQPMIFAIALGQLILGILFLGRGLALQVACAGAIIFLLSITPLGMGAAFPFTIITSIGAVMIFRATL